jgi:hypothetical protein
MSITTIIAASIVSIISITGFGNSGIAQGQTSNRTPSSLSLTPEQKAAIRNPNNPASKLNSVNTTESKICGIPKTVKPHLSSSNMTTGAQAAPPPPTSIAPSAAPP